MILAITPLLVLQAAAPPVHPVTPWSGSVQVMNCDVVQAKGGNATFALTLMDDKAFVADGTGAGIKMELFAPTKNGADIVRGNAIIRRMDFDAADAKIVVRQLYQANTLRSTFVVIGDGATDEQNLAFEQAAGFCRSNSTETNQ